MRRAAIYSRVSTTEQAERGTSLATQENAARDLAKAHGHRIVDHLVIREDWTGTDLSRPGITRLKEAAKRKEFDVLVAYTLDRIFRPENEGDEWRVFELLGEFKANGVEIEFVDLSIPTSGPLSSVIGFLRTWMAGQERKAILDRTSRGRAARRAEGKWVDGRPPYGYRRGPEGMLEEVPDKSRVVRHLYDKADTDRIGLRQLQKLFNGLYTAPGGRTVWGQNTIYRILTNTLYMGKSSSGAVAPAIITEAQFARVQARLASNRHLRPSPKHKRPLMGRAVCGCGGRIAFEPHSEKSQASYYFCKNRRTYSGHVMRGGEKCTVKPFRADFLEKALHDGLYESFSDPAKAMVLLRQSVSDMRAKYEALAADVGPMKEALEKVREELKQIERSRIKGILDGRELDKLELEADARRAELEARLATVSPDRLAEMENLARMLKGSERVQEIAANRIREKIPMNVFDLHPDSFETDDSEFYEDGVHWPLSPRKGEDIGQDLGRLLDRLHAEVIVYRDRAEVTGLVEVGLPISAGKSLQAYRSSTR